METYKSKHVHKILNEELNEHNYKPGKEVACYKERSFYFNKLSPEEVR